MSGDRWLMAIGFHMNRIVNHYYSYLLIGLLWLIVVIFIPKSKIMCLQKSLTILKLFEDPQKN